MGRQKSGFESKCQCRAQSRRPPALVGASVCSWYPFRLPSSNNLLTLYQMRRGILIVTSLVAILLLARPFDCFANPAPSRAAADCCKKGKCTPSENADDCCKATVPGGVQFLGSKASDHSAPVADLANANEPGLNSEFFKGDSLLVVPSPPGSPSYSHLNLPLLI